MGKGNDPPAHIPSWIFSNENMSSTNGAWWPYLASSYVA